MTTQTVGHYRITAKLSEGAIREALRAIDIEV